jgi:hypothetical protein
MEEDIPYKCEQNRVKVSILGQNRCYAQNVPEFYMGLDVWLKLQSTCFASVNL